MSEEESGDIGMEPAVTTVVNSDHIVIVCFV